MCPLVPPFSNAMYACRYISSPHIYVCTYIKPMRGFERRQLSNISEGVNLIEMNFSFHRFLVDVFLF
jgi:hypothetical protein